MHVEVTGIPDGDMAVADFVTATAHGTGKFISVKKLKRRPLHIKIVNGDERDLDSIVELGLRARVISGESVA